MKIRVDEILAMRGYKKHVNGGFRPEQKIDVAQRLLRLDKVHVRGRYVAPDNKPHVVKGRMLEIAIDYEVNLVGEETPYAFIISPGKAAWQFYVRSAYLAPYFTALARLNTSKPSGNIAYLIGRHLVYQFRVRAVHKNYDQPYRVGRLLKHAGVEIPTDSKRYKDFLDYVETAMDRLVADGVIAEWAYEDRANEKLPATRWFGPWKEECAFIITPPALILEQSAEISKNRAVAIGPRARRKRSRALRADKA